MDSNTNDKLINYNDKGFNCSLAFALHLIGDKYKSLIIFHLKDGPMRSGELQKSITDLSNRMFTYAIRALEKDKLVSRKIYPVTPPKVEYALTKDGESLIPIIMDLNVWGQNFIDEHQLSKPEKQ